MWKPENTRVIRFAMVRFMIAGGLSTLTHWSVMAVLMSTGALPEIATASGALAGAGVNYALQKSFTFHSTQRHLIVLPRYVFACALLWLSNLLIFSMLVRLSGTQVIEAQVATTALVALLSYGLFKRNVFNDCCLSAAVQKQG